MLGYRRLWPLLFLTVLLCCLFAGSPVTYAATTTLNPSLDSCKSNQGSYPDGESGTVPDYTVNWVGSYQDLSIYDFKSYTKFDLSSINGTVTSATFKIYVKYIDGSPIVNLYGSNVDAWTEDLATVPTEDDPIVTNGAGISLDTWRTFDVTTFVNSQAAGDKTATLVLTGYATGNNDFAYCADEDPHDNTYRPQLEITYTPAATVSSVGVPANGTYGVGQNLDFTVNYDQAVTVTSTPYIPITLDTGGTAYALYTSGSDTSALTFRYTVQTGHLDTNGVSVGGSITLNGGTISNGAADASLVLNSVGSTAAVLVDGVAPTITSSTLAASNAYIDVVFSEGVYGAADGTTALTAAKLDLTFTRNSGAATNAAISSVKQNDSAVEGSASPLAGGETTVRVFLTITGTPSGVETIEIKPANGASVYDKAGNAVLAAQTTGVKTLNDKTPPTMESAARTDDTHITVTLSENCANIAKANDGGFTVQETGNPAVTYTVSSIAQGVDASHVVLTVADLGISAKEGVTVKYTAGSNGTVQDTAGNALATDDTGVAAAAWDTTAPTLESAARTDNTHITVTLSENCANITKANDGGFTVAETGSPGTTYTVFSIAQGVDASHVVLTVADLGISAKEGVTVKYTAGSNGTVQDIAGNDLATDGTGVAAAAWDITAPTILSGTLAATNTYIDITFSEGIYGAADGTTALTAAKLDLTFTRNAGAATNAASSSVKQNDSAVEGSASPLAGGETTVRVFLTITGTPSGVETIEIKPADGASVYDKAGNAVLAAQTTGVKTLNDKTPPTLESAARTDDTHITVTLSENCANIAKANDGGFTVQETGNPAVTYTVSSIAQGVDASHVVLTVADLGVSAKEGVTVKYTASGNGTVQDTAGNAMATDDTGVAAAAWDTTAPTILSGTLAASNTYIDIVFSEGVYGAADGTTALTAAKLALTFTRNAGGATNAQISSVKQNDSAVEGSASALAGGETTVRVFLTVTGTPSGVETIEIKPAGGASVYDQAGNAALETQTTGVKTLNDQTPPTLESAARTDDTHITVTLSKNCVNIAKANDGGFTVQETGNPAVTYTVSSIAQGVDASHVVLTVADLGVSAKEGVTVKYTAGGNGTVQDTLGNVMLTDITGTAAAAWDTTAPTIASGALAATNTYIDITFSEGIYGAADGTTALTAAKLDLTFTRNAGAATNAASSSVKQNDSADEGSASALAGGETTVRVFLTVTGTPSGVETIEIKPASGASVYDKAGNAALETQTTGVKTLNDKTPPTLESAARTDDTHITVTLSENCANITKPNDGGFTVQETGKPVVTYTVSSIAQGVDASHVVLTVADLGISAKEGVTVKYTSGGNGTVQDIAGNALATDGTGVAAAAWDTTAPTILSGTLAASNTYIDVVFSEGIYGAADGTTALTAAKLALTFTRNAGGATNAQISSVKQNDSAVEGSASALAGGETTVRVFLTITGTPSGVETIEIKPAGGASVYDQAGNTALETQTTGVKTLNDQTPPTLESAARTDDTHITVTLSKNCVNIAKANDGGFTVAETGSPGTTYTVSAIAQGVDASHVVLTVADLGVSAKEGVTVKYTAGGNGTVQDTLGNVMLTDTTGTAAAAWDTTAPTILSGTLAATNAYIDVVFSEGIYGAADGTTALTAAKLDLTFTRNAGAATNAAISSVKQNDSADEGSASALAGGETTVRVFLTVTGTPSGTETIEIKPANAASIYDQAGNAALAAQTTGVKTLNDKLAPTVTSVTVPAGGAYGAGQDLDFTVNFSEDVVADTGGGTPYLQLTVGTTAREAGYISGSGSSSLLFRYTIQPADRGSVTVGTLEANGATIKDPAGNDADPTLNNIGDIANISVSEDITLNTPNGGETWAVGSSQTIRWNYTGSPGQAVRIELLKGDVFNQVVSYGAYTGSDGNGACQWTVPAGLAAGNDYQIRVTSILENSYTDTSNSTFTITGPQATSITVSVPVGTETWAAGSSQTIRWNYNGSPGDLVKIELLKSGAVAKVINAGAYIGLGGSGSCQWTVPSGLTAGSDYQIRVTSNLNNTYTNTSGAFTISGPQAPSITVSEPVGAETWAAGSSQTIRWNYNGKIGQTVKVELLKSDAIDRVITYSAFIGSSGSGSCQWTVPAGLAAGSDYKIRVTSTTDNIYTDTSDEAFTITGPIVPAITVSAPVGTETWAVGSSQTIRWSHTGNPGYLVRIELLKNDALNRVITYGALIGTAGRGAYQWKLPAGLAAGDDYKIRVTSVSNNAYTDTGDEAFSITPAP